MNNILFEAIAAVISVFAYIGFIYISAFWITLGIRVAMAKSPTQTNTTTTIYIKNKK